MQKETKLTIVAIVFTTIICGFFTIYQSGMKDNNSTDISSNNSIQQREDKVENWTKDVQNWKESLSEAQENEINSANITALPNTGPVTESE